jgi:hypothetical protein
LLAWSSGRAEKGATFNRACDDFWVNRFCGCEYGRWFCMVVVHPCFLPVLYCSAEMQNDEFISGG